MPIYVSSVVASFCHSCRTHNFHPSPQQGWGGLTSEDNTQALQTVKMLKEFIDADIEVVLRFGHEVVSG